MIDSARRGNVDRALPTRPRRRLSLSQREAVVGVAFVAPQLVGFAIFVLIPLVGIFAFSLFDWHILREPIYIGLENFTRMFDSPEVAQVTRTTILFSLGFVPLTVASGLILALALNAKSRINYVLRSAYFLPLVISLAAWTIVWRLILQSNGALNGMLEVLFGITGIAWLRESDLALLSVILIQVLKSIGYAMILFLAALQTVPSDLRDAARVDGAGEWQSFWSITWPLIAPFTFMVTILLTIGSFQSFALIFLLTKGGPGVDTTVISYYIYQRGLQLFEVGYSSALAVVLFISVITLTILQFVARRRWVYEG